MSVIVITATDSNEVIIKSRLDTLNTWPINISSKLNLVPPITDMIIKPIEKRKEKIIPIDVSVEILNLLTKKPINNAMAIALGIAPRNAFTPIEYAIIIPGKTEWAIASPMKPNSRFITKAPNRGHTIPMRIHTKVACKKKL